MSGNSGQLENVKKHINFTYEELRQVAETLGAFSLQMIADPPQAANAIQTIELGGEVRRRQLKTGLHEAFDRQRLVWLLDELQQLCALKRQLEKSMGSEPELFPWQVKGFG
jgi:hypothetical protein